MIRIGVPCIFLAVVVWGAAAVAQAPSWQGRLQDGSRVEVDPSTNRAIVYRRQGVATQLWDGVHRLEDGSSITVRSGVMVPNTEVIRLRQGIERTGPFAVTRASPCVVLVRKVCGLHDECAGHPACDHARQLHGIEQDEARDRAASGESSPFMQTPAQCAQAAQDETFFVPCDVRRPGPSPTPCERLVTKVCGTRNQCADREGCSLATQLSDNEHRDRLASRDPEQITDAGRQCTEAFADKEMFAPCGR